jgi:uronate dehydrogenase
MIVAVTGAGGAIGTTVRSGIRERYDELRLLDRVKISDCAPNETAYKVDVRDLDAMKGIFTGCDAIVHLAGIPDESSYYDIEANNITGTYCVFEAAKRAGVGRIVYASSNHVIGFHDSDRVLDVDAPMRPDSYYGVSKVFGEALGQLYHDKWGLEVACLRIGSFRPVPQDERQLSTWLGPDDAVDLFARCLDAETLDFSVIYGVSANTDTRWRNGPAAEAIGFHPTQDAEIYRNQVQPSDSDKSQSSRFHGGMFTLPDYTGAS